MGFSWATWWQVVDEMRAKIAPRGAKKSPRGAKIRQLDAKLEESCGQEAPKKRIFASSWDLLGPFGKHFRNILGKKLASKNLQKPLVFFLMVFDSLGGPGERLGGYVGRCWLQVGRFLAHLEAMLGDVGAKMKEGRNE